MKALLSLSRAIDAMNRVFGVIAIWLVLLSCVISAGAASARYLLSMGSNAWLEMQWYMFAGNVMLGAPYTLFLNEHVRVDLLYANYSERTRAWIDILGGLFFLLPFCLVMAWLTWPWFVDAWRIGETSQSPGGLIRWPVKLLMPVGFALVALQGISEIIKRFAVLEGLRVETHEYQTPVQ